MPGPTLPHVLKHGDLWATAHPSAVAIVVVSLLMGVGIVAVFLLLRSREERAHEESGDPLSEQLAAIGRARARLLEALEHTDGPIRGALNSMIAEPLRGYDARIEALVATARSFAPVSHDRELARLSRERARLEEQLQRESEPRARVLFEASLRDLEATESVRRGLARNARLAGLELERMRTLLESLPTRVEELAARQILNRADKGNVEAIARQLEIAVKSTGEVLDEVLPPVS